MRLPTFHVRSWKTPRQHEGKAQADLPGAAGAQSKSRDTLERISSEAPAVVAAPIFAVAASVPPAVAAAQVISTPSRPAALSLTQAMTLEGLRRWTLAPGLSTQEAQQRKIVAGEILKTQAVSHDDIEALLSHTLKPTSGIPRLTLLKWRLTGLDVKGDLRLDGLHSLTSLPDGLEVRGACRIKNCRNLKALPKGFMVSGNLTISGCPNLTQLHADLRVAGACTLSHCPKLVALPESLKHVSYLRLKAGNGVSEISANFTAGGDVELVGCGNLIRLGDNFRTYGGLSIKDCPALSQLPKGLRVGQHLYLESGNNLTEVPAYTRVGGDLDIAPGSGITHLGEHLQVDGNVYIIGSPTFRFVAPDLALGGDLILSGSTQLDTLPASLMDLGACSNGGTRFIDVRGTGVSLERIMELREQADGIMLLFAGQKYSKTHVMQLLLNHFELQPCAAKINTWPAAQQEILKRYLGRARKTADYKHVAVRPALFERVRLMMQAACQDEAFRDRALVLLEDAMQSCGDRVIQGLDQVEVALALGRATSGDVAASRAALQALGLQFLKLGVVHAHAAASCQTIVSADDVEVYLAYETQLRKRLNLPGSTVYMLYGSGVAPRDIEAAAQDAERQSQNPHAVAAFLDAWSPWQRQLRREQAQSMPYAQLPLRTRQPRKGDEELVCPFTQMPEHEVQDAVYGAHSGSVRVYSFASLMTWWLEHGTDSVNRDALSLDDLWREG